MTQPIITRRSLVIGFGSIGRRHARILTEMGHNVAVVSRQAASPLVAYTDIGEAISAFVPEYVVVCTPTLAHIDALTQLASIGFSGPILVEKPLVANNGCQFPAAIAPQIRVGYNLRFHPCLTAACAELRTRRLFTITAYCGQYLPDWRQGIDYRASYSARSGNGGVLRDLSHELDCVQFLAGPWQRVAAFGGTYSDLGIESEDCASLLLGLERCPLVTIHINYLDRIPKRSIVINHDGGTLALDLVASTITQNGNTSSVPSDRDETMRDQHRAIFDGGALPVCSFAEGMATVRLISAAEKAISEGRVVNRGDT